MVIFAEKVVVVLNSRGPPLTVVLLKLFLTQAARDLELRTLDATSSRVAHGFWQDTQSKVKAMLAENAFPEVSPRVFRMKRTF